MGLANGVLVRSLIDNITGSISDTRQELIGNTAVSLASISIQSNDAVIALSSRTHLCFSNLSKYKSIPFSYEQLDSVAAFTTERCQEGGMVALCENSLRIIKVDKLSDQFTHSQMSTRYTPVKLIVHPETGYLIVHEKDHCAFNEKQLDDIKQ